MTIGAPRVKDLIVPSPILWIRIVVDLLGCDPDSKMQSSKNITPSRRAKCSGSSALVKLLDGHGKSWQVVGLLGVLAVVALLDT